MALGQRSVQRTMVGLGEPHGRLLLGDEQLCSVVHLSAAGVELWRSASGTLSMQSSVSVNPTDGSCWVGDYWTGRVVHLSEAGEELWQSVSGAFYPRSISVNPSDGSCWVASETPVRGT